jgi:Skp family chaperone for outer membrane proteins
MRTIARTVVLVVSLAFAGSAMAQTPAADKNAHVDKVTAWVNANVKPWLSDPKVVEAVKAANKKHANLDYLEIQKLDEEWKAKSPALVEGTMGNELSTFLKARKTALKGIMTEAFVMDDKGLNVGQTDGTSDYFQADEPKWQKSYGGGSDAVFVDAVEEDGGKKIAQASLTISDGGKAIGAITVGIDVDQLK